MTGTVQGARTALRTFAYGATAAVTPHGRPRHRRTLLVAPAGPGSEGDALLLAGMAITVGSPTYVDQPPGDRPWSSLETGTRALLARAARVPRPVGRGYTWAAARPWNGAWFVGADVFDGAYGDQTIAIVDRLDALRRAGVRTGVIGFSWRPRPLPTVLDRVRRSAPDTLFVARGDHSAERFRAATDRECHVAPDLSWAALLAEIDAGAVPPVEGANVPRLGVNLSRPVVQQTRPQGRDPLVDVVTRVAARRRAEGFALSLISHDERPEVSDIKVLTPVARALDLPPSDLQMVRGAALRRRIAACDIVVTGRMHLGISALAHGVPVVGLAYLDKFEDLKADPLLGPRLRLVDPAAADAEARIDAALDELLPLGRASATELAALYARQRGRLAALSELLAERIAAR